MFPCTDGHSHRCSAPSRFIYGHRAERGRRRMEDGRPRTEDGRPRTEDGGPKQSRRPTDRMAEKISSFKDLRVYQAAFQLQQAIFETTRAFPSEERYALTDQIRRSARSIGANLAEAWQKRQYPAHFVSKLSDADGEQA